MRSVVPQRTFGIVASATSWWESGETCTAAVAHRTVARGAWPSRIQRASHGVLALVDATDSAVATSGTAERGEHIWLPGPRPVGSGLRSFTVVGPDIAEADAYATVGFAMGEDGMAWVSAHDGYRSLIVRTDGTVRSDVALVSAA